MDYILTIAVPVYNVEDYIRRCLDSIIPQIDKDFELLLVDDGSTDNSGVICDEYQNKYPNKIRVIHQKNHGLAYVRNICIKEANGKYISFIDSDDYITVGAYEHLMFLVHKFNADVLCFGHYDVYKNKDKYGYNFIDPNLEIIKQYTPAEAIEIELISPDIDVITCNKIIRKSLYNGIDYPVGKKYEDMFTTYKFLAKASCIVSTNLRFYVYCHREGSIGLQVFNSKTYDLEKAAMETFNFGMSFCKRSNNLICGYIYWRVVVNNMMIKSDYTDKNFTIETQKIIKNNWSTIATNGILNKARKIEYWLLSHSFPLYKLLYKFYIKRMR